VDAATAIAGLLAVPALPSLTFNLGGGAVTSVASWCEALSGLHPGFAWRIDPAASTVRYGMDRDRSPMDTSRLRATIGTAPLTDDLPARATRYLAWRDSPDGVALCGA
jgi:nucleoside-diphosphate-sugar epimerase